MNSLLISLLLVLCLASLGAAWVYAQRLRKLRIRLEQREDYLETFTGLSSEIHALLEGDRFLSVGEAWTASLGHARETLLAGGLDHFLVLVHPEDLIRVQTELQGGVFAEDLIFRMRDNHGTWRWLRCRKAGLKSPGTRLLVFREISAEHSLEAVQARVQKMETALALARGTIHDLNNVLMGLQGYSEILVSGPLRGKLLGLSDRARELCGRLAAQVEPGRVRIGRISINALIRGSLPQLEALVPDTVGFETELLEGLSPIHGDENLLRQALIQMLVHSTEVLEGQGAITLRTLAEGPDRICIRLEDQGPGLSPPVLARLFDPPRTDTGPGSGLAAVRSIAQVHGGDFRIESWPGKGSLYTLALPCAPSQLERREEGDGTPEGSPTTVLVMDDDPDIRYILRQGLEGEGFQVLEGADGVEGFDTFLRHRSSISLVLLDLTMPRMGGEEVLEGIGHLSPEIPVVLMSGYTEEEAMDAFKGKGLAGFLPKPCKLRDALGVVHEVLARRKGVRP